MTTTQGKAANPPTKGNVGASFVPVYQKLVDTYKESILTCRLSPGDRIDSINDIIARHGVSRETAKLVLKRLEQEGLILQVPGKGSFVADLRPPDKRWAVVVPWYSAQYQDLLSRLAQHAHGCGRELRHFVDYNNWEEELRLVAQLINDRYETVIVVPTLDESKTAEFYARLKPRGSFVTLIDHTMAGSFFSYVIQSYDLGVKRGVGYLLDRGATRIAFIGHETWTGRNLVQELMEETFKEITSESGGQEGLVAAGPALVDRDFVSGRGIDGFFCCDDADAIRILGRLGEHGLRSSSDFHLVSYGNTDLARYFTPGITSIDPHNQEMADTTAEILKRHIDGKGTELSQFVVQPELVVRAT